MLQPEVTPPKDCNIKYVTNQHTVDPSGFKIAGALSFSYDDITFFLQ